MRWKRNVRNLFINLCPNFKADLEVEAVSSDSGYEQEVGSYDDNQIWATAKFPAS
jgi:hypothetical protein